MNFVAIHVETANADCASICQIGVAKYRGGKLVQEWSSLINPEDKFDEINIFIHGITENDVVDSPVFDEVKGTLNGFLQNDVSVHHTHFDRSSIRRALTKYGLPEFRTSWLDSSMVVRRAWLECARSGYGLASVCEKIGYSFRHHDALEDAKACAQVLLAAVEATGLDIDAWVKQVSCPIGALHGCRAITRDGDPEGDLCGEVVAFTGSLKMLRRQAAELAARAGCAVEQNVTKRTTLLVVGDQDVSRLAGHQKSIKHRKAEHLITQGQNIKIIKESDFEQFVHYAEENTVERRLIAEFRQRSLQA